MPDWKGSTRRETLPADWEKRRARVFRRDGYQCTASDAVTDERCRRVAEECDHVGNRMDHSDDNLTSLCSWHHQQKSSSQGYDAMMRKRQKIEQLFRRDDKHPGMK